MCSSSSHHAAGLCAALSVLCTAVNVLIRSSNNQMVRILVPMFWYIRRSTHMHIRRTRTIGRSTVRIFWYYVADLHNSLDSSTLYFVCAGYNNKATAAAEAACGCGARREGVGISCGAPYVWIQPSYEACVRFSCFVSCHNLPSYHTKEERRTNTRAGQLDFKSSCSTAGAVQSIRSNTLE